MKLVFFASLFTFGAGASTPPAALPCQVADAVQRFQASANDALAVLPALDKDVDNCFNRNNPSYIQQAHQILEGLETGYKQSGGALAQALRELGSGGQPGAFQASEKQVDAELAPIEQTVDKYAWQLKQYGFTTSDSTTSSGQPLYPDCNSAHSDHPDQLWARFYGDFSSLKQIRATLDQAATCLAGGH